MFSFFKIFAFPSPKDLGVSESNALPSRKITPDDNSFSWEDYDELIKKKYPIKYLFFVTIFDWIKYNIIYPFLIPTEKFIYFLKCHLIRSKRYHLLDLRQPKNNFDIDTYCYGWIDPSDKMMFALFNILREYVQNCKNHDLRDIYSEEEIKKDPGMSEQQFIIDEARDIYNWWSIERKKDLKECENLYTDLTLAIKNKNIELKKDILNKINSKEWAIEYKTDEMLIRLLKIRKGLWY